MRKLVFACVFTYVCSCIHRDGHTIWLRNTVWLDFDDEGKPLFATCTSEAEGPASPVASQQGSTLSSTSVSVSSSAIARSRPLTQETSASISLAIASSQAEQFAVGALIPDTHDAVLTPSGTPHLSDADAHSVSMDSNTSLDTVANPDSDSADHEHDHEQDHEGSVHMHSNSLAIPSDADFSMPPTPAVRDRESEALRENALSAPQLMLPVPPILVDDLDLSV